MAGAERIYYRPGIEVALRFLRHEGLQSKKQLLQTKLPQLQKVEVLLRRPSRLSLERLPAGRAFLRLT